MERPHFVAAAGASFREHAHRLAFAQAVGHHLHHPTERFGVAALVEDGLATCGQPTDQRPAGDLALGDEAHHALAVKDADVDPADVVGDEQHRAGQRLADLRQAEAEDPHQPALPPVDHLGAEGGVAHAQFAPRRQHADQDERQEHDDVDQQPRYAVQVTAHTRHAATGGRSGGSHPRTIPEGRHRCQPI
ncbi:hypothetical protein G6F63_014682 [Rhizopus arrhizus]|nr:hypothetical protein G6F63_014682 [Rhizopus arrhizus]